MIGVVGAPKRAITLSIQYAVALLIQLRCWWQSAQISSPACGPLASPLQSQERLINQIRYGALQPFLQAASPCIGLRRNSCSKGDAGFGRVGHKGHSEFPRVTTRTIGELARKQNGAEINYARLLPYVVSAHSQSSHACT